MPSSKFLRTYKNDIAPIGFFFDLFKTEDFEIPILPLPMRIDKMIKGEPTFFVIPDLNKVDEICTKLDLAFNIKIFYLLGFVNLISYGKKKFSEKVKLEVKKETIRDWYNSSLLFMGDIPSLTEDFTFMLIEYLEMYADFLNQEYSKESEEHKELLKKYCEIVIKYFDQKIDDNKFTVVENGENNTVQLYKQKRQNYYPEIVTTEITYSSNELEKTLRKNFIPYLIYDDLLEVFHFNKMLLSDEYQNVIDLKTWKLNGIINKRSTIKHDIVDINVKKFKLLTSDLEKII